LVEVTEVLPDDRARRHPRGNALGDHGEVEIRERLVEGDVVQLGTGPPCVAFREMGPAWEARVPRHRGSQGRLVLQHLLDTEIAAAITAGGLAVNYRRDVGKAIVTMCTALVQWFQPDGRTTPEQIAKEYAQFALRLLGYNAMR
jgi:hypothetical protein